MNRPDIVSAKAVEEIVEVRESKTTSPTRESKQEYGENMGQFDDLTITAWQQTKLFPYSSEYFKMEAPTGQTFKDLHKIDEWVIEELKNIDQKPTVYNFKKMMKRICAEEGIKTYEDFIQSKFETPQEELSVPEKITKTKSSDFIGFLKSLVKILE